MTSHLSVVTSSRQVCTFSVGDMFFGVDVQNVHEVIRAQEMTRVPMAPAVVRGLINLRGRIVTAVDMRARLRLPPLPDDQESMNVVVQADEGSVSLLVDEISDVFEVVDEDFEPLPPTLQGVYREFVRGIYKLDDRLLLILDTDQLLELPEILDQSVLEAVPS